MRCLAPALVALMLTLPTPALACRCAERTLLAQFADADLVFLGLAAPQAVPRVDLRADAISLRFHLLGEPYKGDPARVRVFRTGPDSASCGVPIEPGATYLVFAKRDADDPGVAEFSTCNGARRYDPLDPDDAGDFPDVPAERALEALTELRATMRTLAPPVASEPRAGSLIGLLALPSTFDRDAPGAADEVDYAQLPLRADPREEAPVVRVVRSEADVLTREHAYERDAAMVVAEHDGWLQLRTPDGALGWLEPPPSATYWPLEALLPGRIGYLTSAWDGRLWGDPGRGLPYRPRGTEGSDVPVVDITEARRVADGLWLRVKLYRHDPCTATGSNSAEIGWLPAWAADGELTAWFWSRGC